MGEAALSDGFHLIGFETMVEPTVEELELILRQLVAEKQKAFVVLDHRLAACDSPMLQLIRAQGGRIIITEAPPLNAPDNFHCEIDAQLHMLLGSGDSGERNDD